MAYVATRGGEQAIEQAERLFRAELGTIDASRVATIEAALPWLVDRLMGEASLYPGLFVQIQLGRLRAPERAVESGC